MNTWIFVVNAKNYPAINKEWKQGLETTAWVVRQHKDVLTNAIGDRVYLHLTTKGLVARGEIDGKIAPSWDIAGWTPKLQTTVKKEQQVSIRINQWVKLEKPIPMKFLRANCPPASSKYFYDGCEGNKFPN